MVDPDHVLSIIVLTSQPDSVPVWLDDLTSQPDISIRTAGLDNIWDQLSSERPAALILRSDNDEAFLTFLEDLHSAPHHRPVIILVTNDIPDQHFDDLTDLALPNMSHPLIAHQIRQAVRKNDQYRHLHQELERFQQSQTDHQRAVKDVETMKNAIVRNVTHELNTPLLQVKSAVALIGEDMENSSLIDYAQRATARLEGAVKNITQLAASLDDMQMSPLIIRENIDSALRMLGRTWEHKKDLARINVEIEEKLPLALGDRQGITIVLQQLLDNALKFSQDRVEVTACRCESGVKIAIQDHGIGIDKAEQTRIFDSFYQVDQKSTRQFNGTGVGLANVRLIMERHGADIQIESFKNRGSTFSFQLPVARLHQ